MSPATANVLTPKPNRHVVQWPGRKSQNSSSIVVELYPVRHAPKRKDSPPPHGGTALVTRGGILARRSGAAFSVRILVAEQPLTGLLLSRLSRSPAAPTQLSRGDRSHGDRHPPLRRLTFATQIQRGATRCLQARDSAAVCVVFAEADVLQIASTDNVLHLGATHRGTIGTIANQWAK
jgi:hypothetical protein